MAKKETAKREAIKDAVAKKDAGKAVASKKDVVSKDATSVPVKRSVAPVLTTTDIGEHIASTFDLPKSHAKIYFNEAVALIGKHLKKGSRIRIAGLGVFQVKKRAARKGRNPNTGEQMKIKASKRIVFAAARDLKAKL